MPDPDVQYSRVRDEETLTRDGRVEHFKLVTLYIGPHGPFNERFTPEEWADGFTVRQRVEKLKAQIASLPT